MLNPRQEAFCISYASGMTAAEAYRKAGFKSTSKGAAAANASRLLADERVQARLRELAAKIESEKIANVEEIQKRLTAILRDEVKSTIFVPKEGVIEVPVSTKDKLKAAELLCKTHGAFLQRAELELSTVPVVIAGQDKIPD